MTKIIEVDGKKYEVDVETGKVSPLNDTEPKAFFITEQEAYLINSLLWLFNEWSDTQVMVRSVDGAFLVVNDSAQRSLQQISERLCNQLDYPASDEKFDQWFDIYELKNG